MPFDEVPLRLLIASGLRGKNVHGVPSRQQVDALPVPYQLSYAAPWRALPNPTELRRILMSNYILTQTVNYTEFLLFWMVYLNPGGELLIQLLLVPGAQLGEEGGRRLTLPLL